MKQTIPQMIESVQNAPGSMYTREDVISMLNRIESTTVKGIEINKTIITDLCDAILEAVKDNARNLESRDVCDLSSAEFSLNGNEIELDSIDIDTDQVTEEVVHGLYDVVEEFFETLEEENKDEESND